MKKLICHRRFLSQNLDLLFLLGAIGGLFLGAGRGRTGLAALEIPPAADATLAGLLPGGIVFAAALAALELLLDAAHLAALLLHLGLDLFAPALLALDQHLDRFPPPGLLHFPLLVQLLRFGRVDRQFALPEQERARVRDAFVQVRARARVQERHLRFFQSVEGAGRERVGAFVGMDEEGEGAVLDFYLRVRHSRLEVEDCVAV